MDPHIAQIALAFLDRVDLKGSEADAFVVVKQNLTDIVLGENKPTETGYPAPPDESGDIFE